MNRQLWTIKDVAEYFNVAEKTIHRMIQRDDLPATRIGGQWRFSPQSVESWVAGREVSDESDGTPGAGKSVTDQLNGGAPTVRDLLVRDPLAVPLDRIIGENHVVVLPAQSDPSSVRETLVGMLVEKYPAIDKPAYLKALEARERLATVALGRGVCAPHLRDVGENPAGSADIFVAVHAGGSLEGEACWLTALVVADDLVVHLRLLQKITMLVRRHSVDRLAEARSSTEALRILIEIERSQL